MERENVQLGASPVKKKIRTAIYLAHDIVGASKREFMKFLSVTPIKKRVWKTSKKDD